MLRRILVPVEDPDLTRAVLAHIEPLLDADAEGVLLRVVAPDPPDLEARGRQVGSARADLERLCDSQRAAGRRVTADWVEGADPAEVIVAEAQRHRASLIVQATHARQDLERWTRGSITARVLRASPVPLLLFNPAHVVSRFKRILVALDGSEPAARILPLVQTLAQRYGSTVIALRVGPPPPDSGEGIRIDALEGELEAQLAPLKAAGIPCRQLVVPAPHVSKAILEVAEEQAVELIAMTSHGERSALAAWPFGSTSEQVFRQSPVPLLVKRVAHLEAPALEPPRPALADEEAPQVVVPLDGSDLAAGALRALPTLLPPPAGVTLLRAHASPEASLGSRAVLEGAAASLRELGYEAEAAATTGDPASEILRTAARADLVVMASHGRSGLARWVRGSVAERVLRRCPAPLLLLNAASLGDPRCAQLRRILVPHDGSARAEAVLPWVARLALAHDADVVLFRAAGGFARAAHEARETERARLELSLGPALERLADAGVRATPQVAFGPPAHEILAAAGAADLVALSTHGRSGPSRWWFGSVAERVLRHCRRPLLVVRAP